MLKIEITIREIPEKENESRGRHADAFDRMMGHPLDALDELIDSLRADESWTVKRGRHAE